MNATVLLYSWGALLSCFSSKPVKVPEEYINPQSEAEAALIYASNKTEEKNMNKNEVKNLLEGDGLRARDEGVNHTRDQFK